MTPYLAYFKMAFKQKAAYRVDWFLGVLNNCIQIFISIAIWKALYGQNTVIKGVDFSMVVTNFILSLGLSNVLFTDDLAIRRKLGDGSIANELLKPIDYRKILLANNLGEIVYKLISNFIPSLMIASLVFEILPPVGEKEILFYIISIILGFGVLWSLSLIVQMAAFWIINVWSLSTIKNVFVSVLSGAALPLWFMPQPILKIIKYTPFESIYHTPIRIYLGELGGYDVGMSLVKQLIWITLLYSISSVMWHYGKKKIILQGG